MAHTQGGKRIIVALDVKGLLVASDLIKSLEDIVGGFKIGPKFINNIFSGLVTCDDKLDNESELSYLFYMFKRLRGKLFWDEKWHDTPSTISGAVEGIMRLNPWIVSIHASAGTTAIQAAIQARGHNTFPLVAVATILTSFTDMECYQIYGVMASEKTEQFALEAKEAGADAIICSPEEVLMLSSIPKLEGMKFITPGIRDFGSDQDDQKRVMPAGIAITAGADYLVIGRPITRPKSGTPREAALRFAAEIDQALSKKYI